MNLALVLLLIALALVVSAYLWFWMPRYLANRLTDTSLRTQTEDRYRQLLSQYLAGVAVLVGVAASFLQNYATNANFQLDFSARMAHDSREEFFTSLDQLKGTDAGSRTAAIYSMSELVHRDSGIRQAVLLSLMAFIRSQRSIDLHPAGIDTLVPLDVQAAIRIIGERNLSTSSSVPRGQQNSVEHYVLDFTRLALAGADFSGGDFANANFHEANLRASSFARATLSNANFSVADFDYRCLDVVLQESYDHNQVHPERFWDAPQWWRQQVQATFSHANAAHADFRGAQLVGANLTSVDLTGAQLQGANITFADFTDATMTSADFTNTWWMGEPKPSVLTQGSKTTAYGDGPCGKEGMWNRTGKKNAVVGSQ